VIAFNQHVSSSPKSTFDSQGNYDAGRCKVLGAVSPGQTIAKAYGLDAATRRPEEIKMQKAKSKIKEVIAATRRFRNFDF